MFWEVHCAKKPSRISFFFFFFFSGDRSWREVVFGILIGGILVGYQVLAFFRLVLYLDSPKATLREWSDNSIPYSSFTIAASVTCGLLQTVYAVDWGSRLVVQVLKIFVCNKLRLWTSCAGLEDLLSSWFSLADLRISGANECFAIPFVLLIPLRNACNIRPVRGGHFPVT